MPYKDKKKQSEYQYKRQALARAKWLADNGPCKLCGSWLNLEVDHADPTTKVSHRVWSWSKDRRDVELAKCRTLCENCHKEKTKTESLKGQDVHNATISNDTAQQIRGELESGVKASVICKKYNLPKYTVSHIKHGRRYGGV